MRYCAAGDDTPTRSTIPTEAGDKQGGPRLAVADAAPSHAGPAGDSTDAQGQVGYPAASPVADVKQTNETPTESCPAQADLAQSEFICEGGSSHTAEIGTWQMCRHCTLNIAFLLFAIIATAVFLFKGSLLMYMSVVFLY